MQYSIGMFSERTGFGIHTLRYYEKEGLLTPERDKNNRRWYTEADITWVEFIKRLKETGMPIKEIKRYAALRAAGDGTMQERLDLLRKHQTALAGQIEHLQHHQQKLEEKIAYYQDCIAGNSR